MKRYFYLFLIFVAHSISCNTNQSNYTNKNPKVIIIQPFEGLPEEQSKYISNEIQKFYPHIKLKKSIPLPSQAYYKPRNRFRADSLIRILRDLTPENHITLGLTSKDISTTNDGINDWGVMGLGYRPGKSCIASTFRLNKTETKSQFFKVAIHELGHTEGLPHCPEKYCFMRDAEGKNPTNDEKEFCINCKQRLEDRGWKF